MPIAQPITVVQTAPVVRSHGLSAFAFPDLHRRHRVPKLTSKHASKNSFRELFGSSDRSASATERTPNGGEMIRNDQAFFWSFP